MNSTGEGGVEALREAAAEEEAGGDGGERRRPAAQRAAQALQARDEIRPLPRPLEAGERLVDLLRESRVARLAGNLGICGNGVRDTEGSPMRRTVGDKRGLSVCACMKYTSVRCMWRACRRKRLLCSHNSLSIHLLPPAVTDLCHIAHP